MRALSTLPTPRRLTAAMLLAGVFLLSACSSDVLNPAGDIARQQRDIIYFSTALMLIIIVPVMILTVVFAWRYRKGNDATYDPHFDHSTSLELVIWSAPLLIIICLGALTWWSTHLLDPFRPVNRIAAGKPADPKAKPLVVQVISLDWKWLFIYPEQGVASVNELVLPVDRPVQFDLTSTNMMNTFYAPTLAGMIYTMPGMRSRLHAVLNRPGAFDGMSGNYSGAGFSDMRFKLYGVDQGGFDGWVARVKRSNLALDTRTFLTLEEPSEKVRPLYFARIDASLFDRAFKRCVKPGTPCMNGMHGSHQSPNTEGAVFKGNAQEEKTGKSLTPPPGEEQNPATHSRHQER